MDGSVSSTRVTVGGGAALETVIVTGSEVNRRPSASRAIALKVWNPSLVAVVSQETEYGALVSSAPRSTLSSWNWTPDQDTYGAHARADCDRAGDGSVGGWGSNGHHQAAWQRR